MCDVMNVSMRTTVAVAVAVVEQSQNFVIRLQSAGCAMCDELTGLAYDCNQHASSSASCFTFFLSLFVVFCYVDPIESDCAAGARCIVDDGQAK